MSNRRRTRSEKDRKAAEKRAANAWQGYYQEPSIVVLRPGQKCPWCDIVHDLVDPPQRAERHLARDLGK